MNEVKYTINYYYDNLDKEDRYKYVLKDKVEEVGLVDEKISSVPEFTDGFYFKIKDNLPITLTLNENKNVITFHLEHHRRPCMWQCAPSLCLCCQSTIVRLGRKCQPYCPCRGLPAVRLESCPYSSL